MVHLHNHTYFSLHDAITMPKELVQIAKEQGAPAVAITDHGTAAGWYQFAHAAYDIGIKPILGVEAYIIDNPYEKHAFADITPLTEEDKIRQTKYAKRVRYMNKYGRPYYHLILLAMNETGMQNILFLQKKAYELQVKLETRKPRIAKEWLKQYNEGIIASSACLVGEITFFSSVGRKDLARKALQWYLDIFGDRFYLEIMYHGIEREAKAIPILLELAEEFNVPYIITTDTHYAKKEDYKKHQIIHGKGEEEGEGDFFGNPAYYLKTDEEIIRDLSAVMPKDAIIKGIETTYQIADRINLEPYKNTNYILPHISDDADAELEALVMDGIKRKYSSDMLPKALERAKYELSVIKSMGFSDYFLIVRDFIKEAKKRGILVGPGRGSAAGSIVAYAIGIVDVDPLKYGLIFERFLNPARISMPDIDVDFEGTLRDEVYKYLQEKYGKDNVARIATFTYRKARRAVEDAARIVAEEIPDQLKKDAFLNAVDEVKRRLSPDADLETVIAALSETRTTNELKEKLIQTVKYIFGLPRDVGVHAAGVVITPQPVYHYVPVIYNKKIGEDLMVTEFDKDDVEHAGLVKMDLLGISTLSVIKRAAEIAAELTNRSTVELIKEFYDAIQDPTDDNVFAVYRKGDTFGVFQMEGKGITEFARAVQPKNIEQLIAILAIYRPGPIESGGTEMYVRRARGEEDWKQHTHPALHDILEETYGVVVYQEQVMQMASKIAGFSMAEADTLRKAVAKKKVEMFAELKEKFIEGGLKNGYSIDFLNELWDIIEKFGGYGFNKSHSASYALVSYMTAYIKTYYPTAFYAALMESYLQNTAKVIRTIMRTKELGINVLPPDITRSHAEKVIALDNNNILLPFSIIKGIGQKDIEKLEQLQKLLVEQHMPLDEAIKAVDLKPAKIKKLINANAFRAFGDKQEVAQLLLSKKKKRTAGTFRQALLFGGDDSQTQESENSNIDGIETDTLAAESASYGFYLQSQAVTPEIRNKLIDHDIPIAFIEWLEDLGEKETALIVGRIIGVKEKKGKINFIVTDETGAVEANAKVTKWDLIKFSPDDIKRTRLDEEIAKHLYVIRLWKIGDDRYYATDIWPIGYMHEVFTTALQNINSNTKEIQFIMSKINDTVTISAKKLLSLIDNDLNAFYNMIKDGEDTVNVKLALPDGRIIYEGPVDQNILEQLKI